MKTWLKNVVATAAVLATATMAIAQEPLKVAYNPWAGFAAIFAGYERGYFKEAGADFEFVAFPGPGDSLPAVMAGHLDMTLTTPDNVVLLNATADAGLKVIYVIDASNGADGIVAKKDIKTVKDLKGKTVAATIGDVNHLLLLKALEAGGLKEEDINLVNMNPDDGAAAFIAGTVDAAVTWEPSFSKAVAEGNGHKLFTSKDAPSILFGDVVVVSQKTIDEKPKQLEGFIKAMEKSVQYLRSKPEEATDLAGKKWLEADGKDVREWISAIAIYDLKENGPMMGVGGGEPKLKVQLTNIGEFLRMRGKIEKLPDIDAIIDPQFLD